MPKKKADDKGRQPIQADVPERLKEELPPHAQEIYREALNRALDEYKKWSDEERQTTAHRVAESAVREEYQRGEDGKWHRKSGKGGEEDI